MAEHISDLDLSLYAFAELLAADRRDEIAQHTAACQECGALLDFWSMAEKDLHDPTVLVPVSPGREIGLFTAEPGRIELDGSHVLRMERQPIRSGKQVLKFISDKQPLYVGVDPYNFYIDRDSGDNVAVVAPP